jgi:hypothetical protein
MVLGKAEGRRGREEDTIGEREDSDGMAVEDGVVTMVTMVTMITK